MKDEPRGNDIEYLRAIVEPTATDPYIERLRERVAELQASSGYEASIAEVEIERLRTVLRNIADTNIGTRVKPGETTDAANLRAIRDIAREAI